MSTATTNVMLAGVGGQGVLIASETVAWAALAGGLQAKQSEIHGVAQRGGSVVSHVRFGSRVHSPLIRCGEVDFLVAAERLEALRYAHYLRAGGTIIMDDRAIKPIHLPDEPEQLYPEKVPEFLRTKGHRVLVVAALETAIALGDKRCANVVLLGALATRLNLAEAACQTAMKKRFPGKTLALNRRAFAKGRNMADSTASHSG